jgi:hypothetical protein
MQTTSYQHNCCVTVSIEKQQETQTARQTQAYSESGYKVQNLNPCTELYGIQCEGQQVSGNGSHNRKKCPHTHADTHQHTKACIFLNPSHVHEQLHKSTS